MKNIDDLLSAIKSYDGPSLRFMEVCGTHTHNIFEYGIRDILPPNITLISGPGCPVCVTPAAYIDYSAVLSLRPNSVLCTFGDMIRVPGRSTSLWKSKAAGGNVRLMYSPLSVLEWAKAEPDQTFYVTAVGFETTLPIYALMMEDIITQGIQNIRFLTSIKALMPALTWLCENDAAIHGFLGPGHVSAILGEDVYRPLCNQYQIPLAIGGFGFEQIVAAIYDLMTQCKAGTYEVHNLYKNVVSKPGNTGALTLIEKYFVKTPSLWRGLGSIGESGYRLAPEYECDDAGDWEQGADLREPAGCICGSVITGQAQPSSCKLFGGICTPLNPVGPCMVSTEGACGIWYRSGAGKERL